MEEGLGFRFWAWLAGVILACAVGGLVVMLILTKAVYAFCLFGGMMVILLLVLLVAWIHDRRQVKRYEAEPD